MITRALINDSMRPLRPADTVAKALEAMLEMRVRHLPIVDFRNRLVGMVSEEQMLQDGGPETPVGELAGMPPASADPELHIFEATKTMVSHGLTALPVANADGRYLGIVRRHDIFDQFARMLSTQEAGAILALEIESKDYSLARLVHIIEQNNVRILSIASENPDGAGKLRVTLKLDVQDTARVRHVLEHEGYSVVASFSEQDDDEDLQLRVEEFMRYLEV